MAVTVAVAVVVAVAVAAVATTAVAVAMEALVTETVKAAAEVQQQTKRDSVIKLQATRSRLLCGWSPRQSALSHRRHDLGFGTSQV